MKSLITLSFLILAGGVAQASINWAQDLVRVREVWDKGILGQGLTVAVIDSGLDTAHLQMQGQLHVNRGEIPWNGIDDDQNGLIDDVNGWNFVDRNPHVMDQTGHGTSVAGIIAANPKMGSLSGLAPAVKILPIKFLDHTGVGSVNDAVLAIDYAVSQGAKILVLTWGGEQKMANLERKLRDLEQRDILIVVSAGNGWNGIGFDLNQRPVFPAAFTLANSLTVTASKEDDLLAPFGNFGSLVHLAAPGVNIPTLKLGGGEMLMDGSSTATAYVAGAAALLWSFHPFAKATEIREAITDSTVLTGIPTLSTGRLDIASGIDHLKEAEESRLRRFSRTR